MKNLTKTGGSTSCWIRLATLHSIDWYADVYWWQNNYKWCGWCKSYRDANCCNVANSVGTVPLKSLEDSNLLTNN